MLWKMCEQRPQYEAPYVQLRRWLQRFSVHASVILAACILLQGQAYMYNTRNALDTLTQQNVNTRCEHHAQTLGVMFYIRGPEACWCQRTLLSFIKCKENHPHPLASFFHSYFQ